MSPVGNHEDWVSLKRILEIDPNSPNEPTGFRSNITGLFGWKSSDSKTRKRILEAAKNYVFYENPKQELSLLPKTITQSVFAGYAALELLFFRKQTQLVDRYLKNNQCQHGLYLVGWYNCESWDKEDYRKKQAPKISLEDARELFEQQAEELSDENQIIKSFVMNTALN